MPGVVRSRQTFDLGVPGYKAPPIDVADVERVSVRGLDAAAWGSAVVELMLSYDGTEFVSVGGGAVQISSGTKNDDDVNVTGVALVRWEIDTAQSGRTGTLTVYGKEVN